ncbi:pilin [Patescibacteria group bacterium]|nr:pilin [Patescibacteria group bacterium]MBU1672930.1 pilin [Patescibacteria group bacterium]MBU1963348.1 pilin [Patescibacteria group bacterium]
MIILFKNHKAIKIVLVALFIFAMPLAGFSQTDGVGFDPYETFGDDGELSNETGLGDAEPVSVAGRIINVALGILGLFTLILFLYGGFIWMNARGNEEEVSKAKKILTGAVIGLVIVLASYGIANYIFTNVQRTTDVNALNP